MIANILIGAAAVIGAALFVANAIGAEIAAMAEDTQEYPSCDNCAGKIDNCICKYCQDGSCWEYIGDIHDNKVEH